VEALSSGNRAEKTATFSALSAVAKQQCCHGAQPHTRDVAQKED
jgi:hypothetical protein